MEGQVENAPMNCSLQTQTLFLLTEQGLYNFEENVTRFFFSQR